MKWIFRGIGLLILMWMGRWSTLHAQAFGDGKVRVVISGQAVADTTFESGDSASTIQIALAEVTGATDVVSSAMGQTNQPGSLISLSSMGVNIVPGQALCNRGFNRTLLIGMLRRPRRVVHPSN
jgi:hypothetical protein